MYFGLFYFKTQTMVQPQQPTPPQHVIMNGMNQGARFTVEMETWTFFQMATDKTIS